MRVFVTLLAVTLVGLALGAHGALAGSKKPGVSLSVDLGSASAKVDASSGGVDADANVSTPAADVDATVDSSAQTPVTASVDTSTPVADATVDVSDSPAASVSTPVGSTTVRVDAKASVQVKSPVAKAKVAVSTKPAQIVAGTKASTPAGSAGVAVHAASDASNQGSPVAPVQRAAPADPATPKPVAHHAARKAHVAAPRPRHLPRVAAVPRQPTVGPHRISSRQPGLAGVLTPPAAGHAPEAAPGASVTVSTWRAPAAAPVTGGAGGPSGSGLSTAGFFAILTAFLMLVAPIVGRWLRPSIGPALQPAFASLPERPG